MDIVQIISLGFGAAGLLLILLMAGQGAGDDKN
jgi:hypothetical protein